MKKKCEDWKNRKGFSSCFSIRSMQRIDLEDMRKMLLNFEFQRRKTLGAYAMHCWSSAINSVCKFVKAFFSIPR